MSKFIPIACLALLGTAGYASAASETVQDSPQATSAHADHTELRRLSTTTHAYTTLGIRYEMKM